jgi:hypothetical protein
MLPALNTDSLSPDDIGMGSWRDDKEILDRLELVSLTLNPSTITPYQEAVLSWEVTGPTNQCILSIASTSVEAQASVAVSPLYSGPYKLRARRGAAVRTLGEVQLTVDESECIQVAFAALQIENLIERLVRDRIVGRDKVKLDGDVNAVVDEDGIAVHLPLEIEVNNWFDADTDVDVKLEVSSRRNGSNSRVVADVTSVDVDVIWHWVEHILSLAYLAPVQAAAQRILDVCITHMLARQLEDQLARQLQGIADLNLQVMRNNDAENRTFVLVSAYMSSVGFEVIGCPEPEAVRPPLLGSAIDAPVVAGAVDGNN